MRGRPAHRHDGAKSPADRRLGKNSASRLYPRRGPFARALRSIRRARAGQRGLAVFRDSLRSQCDARHARCADRHPRRMRGAGRAAPATMKPAQDYRSAGVDIDAGEALVEAIKPLAKATARPGCDAGLGGFAALFDLKAAGYRDPILLATTDGVGTKLKIAIAANRHETIGHDLVAMCVNDLVVQGAEPLFFLDYFATGKLEVDRAKVIIAGIARACKEVGCALVGGET